MKMFQGVIFVFLLISTAFLFSSEGKSLDIPFIEEGVKIDGKLDEPFYKELKPAENFYQYHPQNGAEPTFKTQI